MDACRKTRVRAWIAGGDTRLGRPGAAQAMPISLARRDLMPCLQTGSKETPVLCIATSVGIMSGPAAYSRSSSCPLECSPQMLWFMIGEEIFCISPSVMAIAYEGASITQEV